MRFVKPEVYLLAQTSMNVAPPEEFKGNLQDYLENHGAGEWKTSPCKDGEKLIEVAGRLCYKAFSLNGENKNVTRVREGNDKYISNLIGQDHGSVLEHTNITFLFDNVSRILTHELVRHRVGVAISQESGRYVRMDNLGIYIPTCFEQDPIVKQKFVDIVTGFEQFSQWASERYNLDNPSTPFSRKKEVTSAIRRLAPAGQSSSLVWTTNLRNARFVLQKRTEDGAEEEIRDLFDPVGYGLQKLYPNAFQDFYRNEQGEWISSNSKRGLKDTVLFSLNQIRDAWLAGSLTREGIEELLRFVEKQ